MNDEVFRNVAELLLYKGPSIDDLVGKAVLEGNTYYVEDLNGMTKLTICSESAYSLIINDIYVFNESELIKQVIILNGKENIVFDKFQEATELLSQSEEQTRLAS